MDPLHPMQRSERKFTMPEPTYTIAITESERTTLAKSLGSLVTKLINAPIQIESHAQSPVDSPSRAALPAAAPVSTPSPKPETVEIRDRWARDRHGVELPNPEGCYTVSVHIFKAERNDVKSTGAKRMKVAFDSPTGKGACDASCWDERLFPFIATMPTQPKGTLHVVQKGKYLNIVGVRA